MQLARSHVTLDARPNCHLCHAPASPSGSDSGFVLSLPDGPCWCCEGCTAERSPKCDSCEEPIWPGRHQEQAVVVRVQGAASDELFTCHGCCAPTHVLRCAWEEWEQYGGPEEGGWHYPVGNLLAAVPVLLFREDDGKVLTVPRKPSDAVDALLRSSFPEASDEYRRAGDSRLRFTFAVSMPAPSYPDRKPHYH